MAADGYCGEAGGAFDQADFVEEGAARDAAVHLNRSEGFLICADNRCGAELVQAEDSCAFDNVSHAGGIVIGQSREGDDVANLGIQRVADLVKYHLERHTRRNRMKKLFFRSQQILNFGSRIGRRGGYLPPVA